MTRRERERESNSAARPRNNVQRDGRDGRSLGDEDEEDEDDEGKC